MGLKMKNKSNGGGMYTPAPAGNHLSVCVGVIDIGHQERQFKPDAPVELVPEIVLVFELVDEQKEGEAGNHFILVRNRASLNEKANLAKLISSWRGKPIEADEEFDLSKLAGKPCMVAVSHQPSKKDPAKVYANVTGVTPLPKSVKPKASTVTPIVWSVDDGQIGILTEADWIPYVLGEPIDEVVKKSREWRNRVDDTGEDVGEPSISDPF
jgi:hypothetical protein